jgi:type II secretory pathway pseudopilin PulG
LHLLELLAAAHPNLPAATAEAQRAAQLLAALKQLSDATQSYGADPLDTEAYAAAFRQCFFNDSPAMQQEDTAEAYEVLVTT